MEQITVERTDKSNLKFKGEIIASASSSANNSSSYFSGSTGRWTELTLYKTAKGKFVAIRTEHSQWQGEKGETTARVCEMEAEIITFFGHGWVAKNLYCNAGISDEEIIE